MKVLKRYLFGEVLLATLVALGLFCLILITGNVLRELASRLADGRISLEVFFQLLGLLLPFVFSFSLPLGFLTGILIGLGRLSSNREIIAIKATGGSLLTIASPIFVLALLGSLASAWINNYGAPISRTKYKTLIVEAVRENPLRFFETQILSREFPGYIFFIQSKEGENLSGFWIWELDEEKRPSLFIRADKGTITYSRENDALLLTLRNGVAESWPKQGEVETNSRFGATTVFFEEFPIQLPLSYSLGAAEIDRDLSEYSLSELLELKRRAAPPDGYEGTMSDFNQEIDVQISNNFSLAFSLFSLSMVGIPLAIRTGRKETYANAMLALGLGLVYYFIVSMIASLNLPAAWTPEYLVWIPNIIMIIVGGFLMRRIYRH